MPPPPSRAAGRRAPSRPVGTITRGTTSPNRLRRVDRWVAHRLGPALRGAADPLVVDLGYGSTPVTTLELHDRLRRLRADVEVVGLEIDPERVAAARPVERGGLRFALGGFELAPVAGRRPVLVRAANVLRQYDESQVAGAWGRVAGLLAPGGLLVDATCGEIGRRAAWVAVDGGGPQSLTVSLRLGGLERPGVVAERLPKALIHRNVPGERVHAWLSALDESWERSAPLAPFGARQRWTATCRAVAEAGWPVLDGPARWRLGEVTVAWPAVAPVG
ncbi:MAG: class I SAM-dependent methyltransferase [Actinomycetes bacterium]